MVDDDLAERLRGLAGMRNLIVHLYTEVDDEHIAAEVAEGLDEIERFAQVIAALARS